MTSLHLLRHGEVDTGGARLAYGHLDLPLTLKGEAQGEALRRHVLERLPRPDGVISSDLSRCRALAERTRPRDLYEQRTTHVTGLVTDLGIEIGKMLYINRLTDAPQVIANRRKLRIHATLILCFFAGGLAGAIGFKTIGYVTTIPLAIVLLILVMRPILHDVRGH